MNTLIDVALRLSGLGWLWKAVDGSKTYIAAAIGILTGLAGLLQELLPPLTAHNAGDVLRLLQHLPQDPAWLTMAGGLAALGIGHKLDKAAAADATPPGPPPSL